MAEYGKYETEALAKLLKKSKKNIELVFNEIYSHYSSKVYGYCIYRSESTEEAQDLMQETWVKFYESLKKKNLPKNTLSYILKTARNLSIDRYRSKKHQKHKQINFLDEDSLEKLADPFDFEKDFEKEEFSELIKLAISNLDDKYKESIALYWLGGMNFREIAEILEETEACVRTRVKRAFAKLSEILRPYFSDIENNSTEKS